VPMSQLRLRPDVETVEGISGQRPDHFFPPKMGTKIPSDKLFVSNFSNELVMIEFGDQNDFGHESTDFHPQSTDLHPRSFGWVAGVVVLAIVLGLVVGVDHGRTVVASSDSLTAARIAAAPLHGSPIPALTSPRPPNRI
jgi:hypothetical protein